MKLRIVWVIFIMAIVSLLGFQSLWLFNTYHLKKEEVSLFMNKALTNAVEQEINYRIERHSSFDEITYINNEDTTSNENAVEIRINNEEVLEAGVFQLLMEYSGYSFDINILDSIFQDNIRESNIRVDFLLCYKDSTGTLLEQTGNLSPPQIDKAYHTDSLLIIDGKRIQAIVDISPTVVFRQMIWLLGASFLMLVVIMLCVIYQAKTIITQYRLNQLREDFTHALTHDMKTPLGSINTVLAQFRNGSLDNKPEMREKFGKTGMNQVAGLLMLVEKILTIAKIEERKLILDRTVIDLPRMVKELEERFSLSKEKEVVISASFELENQALCLDETLIKDAIANLIDNAIKYSGNSVKILIDCYTKDNQLFIRVIDNGFGISEQNQKKIFEKFERGAAVGRKGARGFGLGLNYVAQVAKAHRGIVTLYSTVGEGSEFTILVPLRF